MSEIIKANTFDWLLEQPDRKFSAVITDPPYDLTRDTQILLLKEFERICIGDILVFCSPENQWPRPSQWLFWLKPTSTKNYSKKYGKFVEMIACYKRSTVWNPSYWANHTGVFFDILEESRTHEFQKPISLMERLVRNHTNPGDLVLDPFCGSGATLKACDRTGRRSIGVDIDA